MTSANRLLGTLHVEDGIGVVRMQDRLETEIDDVWAAFTDPNRLVRWLGKFEGDLRLGGDYQAHYFASGAEMTGHVEECDPPNHFLIRIKDKGGKDDDGFFEVTLSSDGNATVVVWEERGMPVDLLSAYGAGIQIHVEDLADHLAGRERRENSGERWSELEAPYKALPVDIR